MAGGSRRFEFGWLEVFGLILVFAGGSVIVFFLGVFVGKGLQESRLAREERVVRLPIDPTVAEAPPARRPARPLAPAPREGAAPEPRPTSAFQLAVRPAASPTTEPAAAPSPVATVPLPRPTEPPVEVRPTPSPEPVRVVAIPTASPRPRSRTKMIGEPRGAWSVQVNATKDAYTARKIVQDLRRRGYNSYAVEVQLRGETWYRVRVGRFPTMQEATAMVVRLKNSERYTRAFLVEE